MAFAVAAVAAAVALPVVLLSVGGGVSEHELDTLQNAGFEVEVSAPGLHGIGGAHGLAGRIAALPDVGAVSPVLSVSLDVFGPSGGAVPTLAEGVVPAAFSTSESPSERSLFPAVLPLGDPTDMAHYDNGTYRGPATNDVVLPMPFAESLGVSTGSTVLLSPTDDRAGGVAFAVTGLAGAAAAGLGPTPANAILLPLSDLQLLTGFARTNGTAGSLVDSADSIEVVVAGSAATDPNAVDRVARDIQALVPFYSVSTLSDQVAQAQQATAVLTGFYLALSSVGLAIGLIFLAVVLVRRVETERRSIGIRRALGVPRRQLAALMAGRGLLLGGAGTLGGLAAGWTVVRLFGDYGNPSVQLAVGYAIFDPVTLALLAAGVLALSLLASLGATRAALRLSIPEALR
jgi:ABC-type lipoprotein release transport system permease subunit